MTKTLVLLGSTGSIGTQTLDVARSLGLRVAALAAGANVELMEEQCREFMPNIAAMSDEAAAAELQKRLSDTKITVLSGEKGILECAKQSCDTVLNAIVGRAGLNATLEVVSRGGVLALANKESLVCAGGRVMSLAKKTGAVIIPVDSEHSAIFQCLRAADGNPVRRIILTASGGAFYGYTPEQLKSVTISDALRHPNWSMGAKITVDSATMMNKGLEFIEAMHLFELPPEKITVLIHRQSVIHSAVEFEDGAVIAQLGTPDMRVPIQYALTYPAREKSAAEPLDLAEIGSLTFAAPKPGEFPCLELAMQCARLGDTVCARLNDENESAVARFLAGEIGFPAIYESVYAAVKPFL